MQLDKICSECNTINPLYARFCNSCGHSLSETAVTPQKPTTETSEATLDATQVGPQGEADTKESEDAEQLERFIPSALRNMYLDSKGDIEGERKVVTMVFSDMSGFAAISEKYMDEPEEAQRIINECLRRQAEHVDSLGGYVDKVVGGELVALFGAPIWHEDDATRAVTAAIRMRDAVEEYNDELEKKEGVRLGLHIGINTGEVSVGYMGDDKFMNYTVMGDAVNLAARIMSVAKAGEIFVGKLTYEPTKALFDYKEPRYVELKGKSEPQPIYELIGVISNQ